MRRISGFNLKVFHANVKQQSWVLCVPLAVGIKAGAAESIPGTVRVSGEAAVGAGRAVGVAAVQRDLRDPVLRADIQLLLQSKQFKCQPPCLSS